MGRAKFLSVWISLLVYAFYLVQKIIKPFDWQIEQKKKFDQIFD